VITAAAAFGLLIALMYVVQRSLIYFPERLRTPPSAAGLPEAHEVALDTKDGEKVIVWHVPPRGENRTGAVTLRPTWCPTATWAWVRFGRSWPGGWVAVNEKRASEVLWRVLV
jgi:hypothetical protein